MGDSSATKYLLDADLGGIEGNKVSFLARKPFTKQCFGHLVNLPHVKSGYRHGCLADKTVLAVGYLALQVEMGEAVIALPGSTSSTPVAGATPVFVRAAATGP
jgi:hypothetical protein